MNNIEFLGKNGDFKLRNPENYNNLYFPVAGEMGIKSAISTTLGGDSKITQNSFILEPVSIENLNNNRSSRNFWCRFENGKIYSITGQSAEAEFKRNTEAMDESELTAGLMWQKVSRISKEFGIKSDILSYALNDNNTEIMYVTITNKSDKEVIFTPFAAIPIYGRSADNIRDHRHVTSLLHRIRTTEDGVYVRPTLSFDEHGHQKNRLTYYVCGHDGTGANPDGFYPTIEEFIGLSGSLSWPYALTNNIESKNAGYSLAGKEALGGIKFKKAHLNPGETVSYIVYLGATEDESEIIKIKDKLADSNKVIAEYNKVKDYWQSVVNITYNTGDANFDNFMRWVTFQPFLRRIYGCSFLPHHDYGRGGRGWRDLWQDCLALLMMNPDGVRQMILDNFKGVRIDGTNATIIGDKPGEFKADRNGIPRVWMDHGVWPLMTVKLYIDQTGDIDILNEKVTYFKDALIQRGTKRDDEFAESDGNLLKTADGKVYEGTVLEHLILQNLCAYYEVGEHGHIRLRGADWNDAIDMADKRGESVAFTCAYAGNLNTLAEYVRLLGGNVSILEEAKILFEDSIKANGDIDTKLSILSGYSEKCAKVVSGKVISESADTLAASLKNKSKWIMKHVRETEWVNDSCGNGWINSYYDNNGRRVEGEIDSSVRMMLTGQVFALMSHTADKNMAGSIINSAKKYLYKKDCGGYRINTDFNEEKYDMGRMFGFAYGEKENGAVFSHMTVMFANSLYKNGFVKEAYEALKTLADTSLDFNTSHMYPGIPEYFNADGVGLYSYLTGAASWYMLTVVTECFGVKGELGDLCIEPRLVKEQFSEDGVAELSLIFANKKVNVKFENMGNKDFGDYSISKALINGVELPIESEEKVCIKKDMLINIKEDIDIVVSLN